MVHSHVVQIQSHKVLQRLPIHLALEMITPISFQVSNHDELFNSCVKNQLLVTFKMKGCEHHQC